MTYPIRPKPDDDQRFTLGLIVEVADVLESHGYEQLSSDDRVRLLQYLYRFLYSD